jgi:putative flippase GtrA
MTISNLSSPPVLSIIVPVANRQHDLLAFLARLRRACTEIATEVIICACDAALPIPLVRALRRWATPNFAVQVLHPPRVADVTLPRISLALQQARGTYVSIITDVGQRSFAGLRTLYAAALAKEADVAIATTRPVAGSNSISAMPHVGMRWLAKLVFPEHLWRVADPLGEQFVVRRALLQDVTLHLSGPVILPEILLRCQWKSLLTISLHGARQPKSSVAGQVKHYAAMLPQLAWLACAVPTAARFWKFCTVGVISAIVNLALLSVGINANLPIWLAWIIGTEGSIICNFTLNSVITWRDMAAEGWTKRFFKFHSAIAVSTLLSLVLFAVLNALLHLPLLAQGITLIIGTFMNYWIAKHVTFVAKQPRMHAPDVSFPSTVLTEALGTSYPRVK